MSQTTYTIVLLLSFTMLACSPARPKPLAQPDVIVPQGDFVHAPSGMKFPQQVGEFERRAVQRKDTHGLDMSARYELLSMSLSISVDVDVFPMQHLDTAGLPAEMVAIAKENLTQQTFETRKREFMSSHADARLAQEGDATLPLSGRPVPGMLAVFDYEDQFLKQRQRLRSQLYLICFTGGEWAVQYRFTFPMNADALTEVEYFLTNLPWTLQKPAGPKK